MATTTRHDKNKVYQSHFPASQSFLIDRSLPHGRGQAMDWLLARQSHIEKKLAARHLRDGKQGLPIIVYGLLTDAEGRTAKRNCGLVKA
ncbi:MAG: hypothetical protein AAB225_24020 [Acidobacteriota bacterium]